MKQEYSLNPTSRSRRPRKPIEIAMTPMIDIIFLLLVFFLATSSFQMVEKLMPSGTSKIESDESQQQAAGADSSELQEPTDDALEQIIVKLQNNGSDTVAVLNDVALPNLAALASRLESIAQVQANVPIIIDPSEEIPVGDVVKAYDWARQAGLDRVFLATRAPK